MTIMLTLCLGVVMGIVFGFVLEKSRVFEPGMIIAQFQFRKFIMLKVFLTAIITGLIVFTCLFAAGFERLNWKATIYAADIIGGLLLGTGIAIAGACPGTLFAQIGAGYKDSLATFLGAMLGASTFIKLQPWIKLTLLSGEPQQKLTWDVALNMPFGTTACILAAVFALVLYGLERYRPWKKELGKNFDGCS